MKEEKEGMFPRELYAPVNKEREKVPFFQSMFPEQEIFEGMEMFPRELYTFANIEREREREKFLRFDINPNSIRNSTIPTPNRDNLHTSRIPYIYIKRESRKTRITRLQNARKHSQS